MPHDLPEPARAFWRQLAPRLAAMGLLTDLDTLALAEVCVCLSRAAEAEQLVTRDGLLIRGERGLCKNPSCQLSRDYSLRAWSLAARFGLTPADRGRLDVAPAASVDPLEALLAGMDDDGADGGGDGQRD